MSSYTLDRIVAIQERFAASEALQPLPPLPSASHLNIGDWSRGVLSEEAEQAALLYSVEAAGEQYRMLSLGAAPGEWGIKAERAYRWRHPDGRFGSCLVEGDLDHVDMIHEYMKVTGTSELFHRIIHGVIAEKDGVALFPIINPALDWGATTASLAERPEDLEGNIEISERDRFHRELANNNQPLKFRQVDAFSLRTLLAKLGRTDFLHCDVQGAEGTAFPAGMEAMNEYVRLACIATHGDAIHHVVMQAFEANNWQIEADCPCDLDGDGHLYRDGTIVALNPRLL